MSVSAVFLLLLPLLAMQFTDEVNWDADDFIAAGVLLFGAGLAFEIGSRMSESNRYRVAVGIAVLTGLILIWMNLAVGLIGSEDNPANLLYGVVLAVGVAGAGFSRLKAHGMARTMLATALTQALIPIAALLIWKPPITSKEELVGVLGVFAVNAIFVALFTGSALLFRLAARNQA